MVRFAPSPTGSFHIGNLRTAKIAALLAGRLKLNLHIRIEDLDPLRSHARFATEQLSHMRELGIVPDSISHQSKHRQNHLKWFLELVRANWVYPCDCSRKDLQTALQNAPHGTDVDYSGNCRNRESTEVLASAIGKGRKVAWRLRSDRVVEGTEDVLIARTNPKLGTNIDVSGDEIEVNDLEFEAGYHLACAVDDALLQPKWIVRAWDLERAEIPQRKIRDFVAYQFNQMRGGKGAVVPPQTRVIHTALITNENGERLEKRSKGVTLPELYQVGITAQQINAWIEASVDLEHLGPPGESVRSLRFALSRGFF